MTFYFQAMLKEVKTIEMEGLVWGASKLVPVGYGIKKLQVMCVVEICRLGGNRRIGF